VVYELLGDQDITNQWRVYLFRAYDWEPAVKPADADALKDKPPAHGHPADVDQEKEEVSGAGETGRGWLLLCVLGWLVRCIYGHAYGELYRRGYEAQ
jgi:hypothetical protein